MLLTTSLLVSTLVLATQACTDLGPIHARSAMPTNGTSNGTAAVTWGYSAKDGPLAWYAMDPQANQACGEGLNQTPINLNDQVAKVEPATGYPLKYQKVPSVDYLHTHHTAQVQVDGVDKNNTLMVKNQEYYLAQFHFHVPSEHRIEGEFFPLEVHFVHKTRDAKPKLAVLGFMIEIGCENHPLLGAVLGQIDQVAQPDSKAKIADLDLTSIPQAFNKGQVFRYLGSLTTPPCTEGVEWLVSTQPLTVDTATFSKVKSVLKFNSRNTQGNPGAQNVMAKAAAAPARVPGTVSPVAPTSAATASATSAATH